MQKYLGIVVFWCMSLVCQMSYATTFIMKSEDERMVESTRICAIKVLSVTSYNPPPAKARLFASMTEALVHPIECFKDDTKEDFRVIWPGGVKKSTNDAGQAIEVRTMVPGTPDLKKGQEAILYLWRESASEEFTVHGWINGVVNIKWSEKDKDYVIQKQSSRASSLANADSRISPQTNVADSRTLKGYREKVKSVLKTHAEKK